MCCMTQFWTAINFGMEGRSEDLINYAKCQLNQFKGYDYEAKFDLRYRHYNIATLWHGIVVIVIVNRE